MLTWNNTTDTGAGHLEWNNTDTGAGHLEDRVTEERIAELERRVATAVDDVLHISKRVSAIETREAGAADRIATLLNAMRHKIEDMIKSELKDDILYSLEFSNMVRHIIDEERHRLGSMNQMNHIPGPTGTDAPDTSFHCDSCGLSPAHYWHGLRKTLCRRCAEESTYAIAHPWRVRAKRAGEVALLVGAVVIPFSALAVILFKIL